MPENLIERYLTDMGEIRGTRSNVPETSFYPALERLLTDIGKNLSQKVRCVINLANRLGSCRHGRCDHAGQREDSPWGRGRPTRI